MRFAVWEELFLLSLRFVRFPHHPFPKEIWLDSDFSFYSCACLINLHPCIVILFRMTPVECSVALKSQFLLFYIAEDLELLV